jgi:hypothetical protein
VLSSKIPQAGWNNMKVFFAPNTYTGKTAESNELYKFKAAKISFQEIVRIGSKSGN